MMPSDTHADTLSLANASDATAASEDASPVSITVNGRARALPPGTTVGDLLRTLDLDPRLVVVEHNREIVHDRGSAATRRLNTGDVIELVQFVGGG